MGNVPSVPAGLRAGWLAPQRRPRLQEPRLPFARSCCFDNSCFYETFVINKLQTRLMKVLSL